MSISTEATRRVTAALEEAGLGGRLKTLEETARSADDAAASLGVEVAAIVKTLIFEFTATSGTFAGQTFPIAALISGDRLCATEAIPALMEMEGKVRRPDAEAVKAITGYSIGGVSPVDLPEDVIVFIDTALGRNDALWAAAGHTHYVFRASFAELQRITGGRVTGEISTPS